MKGTIALETASPRHGPGRMTMRIVSEYSESKIITFLSLNFTASRCIPDRFDGVILGSQGRGEKDQYNYDDVTFQHSKCT